VEIAQFRPVDDIDRDARRLGAHPHLPVRRFVAGGDEGEGGAIEINRLRQALMQPGVGRDQVGQKAVARLD
jgi:hypothetical protein